MATQTKTTRAGKVGVTPKGAWSATYNNSQGYDLLDEVLHQHDSWISTAEANRDEPSASSAKWFRSTDGGQYAYQQGQAAAASAAQADNVDVSLSGMTLTITRRSGQQQSQRIGFEVVKTYATVAAMNADAANVTEGKFVMIATTDKTSEENARLYVRNAQAAAAAEPFTFLSDLDQASSAAWADWLDNQKPVIEADHQTAQADHSIAQGDHTTAGTDHTTAQSDHTRAAADSGQAATDHAAATSAAALANEKAALADGKASLAQTQADYAKQQGDRAKQQADYPDQIRSDGYVWTYDPDDASAGSDGYRRTAYKVDASLDFDALTPEQYQSLIDNIQEHMVFATVAEGEQAIAELV